MEMGVFSLENILVTLICNGLFTTILKWICKKLLFNFFGVIFNTVSTDRYKPHKQDFGGPWLLSVLRVLRPDRLRVVCLGYFTLCLEIAEAAECPPWRGRGARRRRPPWGEGSSCTPSRPTRGRRAQPLAPPSDCFMPVLWFHLAKSSFFFGKSRTAASQRWRISTSTMCPLRPTLLPICLISTWSVACQVWMDLLWKWMRSIRWVCWGDEAQDEAQDQGHVKGC